MIDTPPRVGELDREKASVALGVSLSSVDRFRRDGLLTRTNPPGQPLEARFFADECATLRSALNAAELQRIPDRQRKGFLRVYMDEHGFGTRASDR